MALFDYSKLHYFDKNGHELMLADNYKLTLTILNNNGYSDDYTEYALVSSSPDDPSTLLDMANKLTMTKLKSGERFNLNSSTCHTQMTFPERDPFESTETISDSSTDTFYWKRYSSSAGTQGSPVLRWDDLTQNQKYNVISAYDTSIYDYVFPSYTFSSNVYFDKVSTGLVETQRVYVLVDNPFTSNLNGTTNYTTVKELIDSSTTSLGVDASVYSHRFKLFFFIDQRHQQDFRFFDLDGDEMVWSDRKIIDFTHDSLTDGSNDSYAVNIGFCGDKEGVYEQPMYICVLDTKDASLGYPGEVYPVGEIMLKAETEGEDERYRAFFKNFGIPDPLTYDNVFRETNSHDDYPDYVSINRHSKEMFLTYDQIFPYVGTYKALFNAVSMLGYDDIFFKEWYKHINGSSITDNGYVAFDMSYKANKNSNTISNLPIEERILLKKLNWLSMMYHINEELDIPEDKFGFPTTIDNTNYYNTDSLFKLVSLKKWLEKYVLGINCHITDIGGEGIVFERYSLPKFGKYQQVLDYTNEKSISPIITRTTEVLMDGSANIHLDISTSGYNMTFDDIKDMTFEQFGNGYIDGNGTYHLDDSEMMDSSMNIFCGKTFELEDDINTFEIRCKGKHDTFRFNRNVYIDSSTPSLLVDDNRIFFDPKDLADSSVFRNSIFTNLPIIQIEKGSIKRFKNSTGSDSSLYYYADIRKNDSSLNNFGYVADVYDDTMGLMNNYSLNFNDSVTLVPPSFSHDTVNKEYHLYPSTTNFTGQMITVDASSAYRNYYVESSAGISIVSRQSFLANGTRGLRFSTDNVNSIPCFKIIGYEDPHSYFDSSVHFPSLTNNTGWSVNTNGNEYYLDIREGRMIFNDDELNRKVALVFHEEDDEVKLSVTELSYSTQDTLYRYRTADSSYSDRFMPGTNYSGFRSYYENDPETAILHNTEKLIKVYNTGSYEVDALLYDEFNNVFAQKSNKTVTVLTPDIDSSTFSLDSSSNNYYNEGGIPATSITQKLDENLSDSWIFEYVPKVKVKSSDDSSLNVDLTQNNYVVGYVPHTGTYANLCSLSNRFEYVGTSRSTFDSSTEYNYSFVKVDDDSGYLHIKSKTENLRIMTSNFIDSSIDVKSCSDSSFAPERYLSIANKQMNTMPRLYNKTMPTTCYLIVYQIYTDTPLMIVPGEFTYTSNVTNNYNIKNEYRFSPFFGLSQNDQSELNNLFKRLDVEYYIIPSWIMAMNSRFGETNRFTLDVSVSKWPFDNTQKFKKGDMIKVMFSSGSQLITPSLNGKYGQTSFKLNRFSSALMIDSISLETTTTKKTNHSGGNLIGSNTPFSQSVGEFVSFHSKVNDIDDNIITLDKTLKNKKLCKILNSCYSASLRNFDIDNAIDYWEDSSVFKSSTGNLNNLYSYNVPITTDKPHIIMTSNLIEAYPSYTGNPLDIINDYGCTVKWKLYKKSGNSKRELLFECYNDAINMMLVDKGDYDVEMIVYDSVGNKYTKFLNGAITYK